MFKLVWGRNDTALCASVLTAGLLIAGCSGGSGESQPLPEASSAAESTADAKSERSEALAAYRAMWQDLVEASKTADADSPRLDDHAKGAAVEVMKEGLRSSKRDKVVIKGKPRLDPVVVSNAGRKAEIEDCVDSAKWLEYKLNGDLKDSVPGGRGKAEAAVEFDKREWKVSELTLHREGTC